MSLPSVAMFIKDNKIVGASFVNCGWFVTANGIVDCIREVLEYAKEVHHRLFSPKLVPVPPNLRRYLKYFDDATNGSDANLPNFEYIWLYDLVIPRDIALAVAVDGTMTVGELDTLGKSGDFKSTFDIDKLIKAAVEEKRNHWYWDDENV